MSAVHADRAIHWKVEAGRFWQGTLFAAVVAALTAFVGLLIIRGLLDLPVLRRGDGGEVRQASSVWYLVVSMLGALAAGALLHLLLLYAPRPWTFYGWIAGLAVVAVTLVPLTFDASASSRLATGCLHLVVGTIVVLFVQTVGRATATPDV
jgi:Family of unknown function (DUF6069)